MTGPLAAKLFVSSSTKDADLFLIVRVFDPEGRELTFMGSTDPNTPIANGLAPGLASPARPPEEHALPALSPARPCRALGARHGVRVRRGDRAHLHRGACRLARGAHRARQGPRVRGGARRVRQDVPLRDA